MAARKNSPKLTAAWRERIKVSMLLKLLEDNAAGKLRMNASRIRSAEILLKKCLPDLASVEHTGELTENVRYVAEMPIKDESTEAWLAGNTPKPRQTTH